MTEILPYSPTGKRRKWIAPTSIVIAILIAGGLAWWRWGEAAWHWFAIVRIQHEIRTHLPATTQPIFVISRQESLQSIGNTVGSFMQRPTVWEKKQQIWGTTDRVDSGDSILAFCHELVSPKGNRRLVLLRLGVMWIAAPEHTGVRVNGDLRLFEIGSPLNPKIVNVTVQPSSDYSPDGMITGWPGMFMLLARLNWGTRFSIREGFPDTSDASKFVIPYQFGSRAGQIIGKLNDDDSVSLKLEDGSRLPLASPTTQP